MTAVVTAASGFDLGYVFHGQAGAAERGERTSGGYYINAAQAGEAPGRWSGRGAAALGLAPGSEVERPVYEAVYRQVDPRDGSKLGRAPGGFGKFAALLAQLKAQEPEATAERLLELERQAARATRKSPVYTDVTASLSKSLSVFHASIRENARQARLDGDRAAEEYWNRQEARYQEIGQAANRAMLEHLEEWAGFTRTGYHGARVGDQEPGRYEPAGLVITSWLQGTSRDGDPQDHVHNQIARMCLTDADGKWRAVDTVAIRAQLPAAQAVFATHVECGLSGAFGVKWVARADGKGNEIAGVTQDQMDAYSSRTQTINDKTPAAVATWTAKYGRTPNRSELQHIQQEVTMATRQGKEDGAIDWDKLAAQWDAKLGGALRSIAPHISDLGNGAGETAQPDGADPRSPTGAGATAQPAQLDSARVIQTALATVQLKSATWTRADLMREVGTALRPETRLTMTPREAVGLVHALTTEALTGAVEQVVSTASPEYPALPDGLRRELDGKSVYTRPGTDRYATGVQINMETRLVEDAQREGAPRLADEESAQLLGSTAGELSAQLHVRAQESREALPSGLRLDQAAAIHHALTSPRTAEVIVGPAGSGKTRTLAEAARMWSGQGRDVVGVTPSQASRNVLANAGVGTTYNFAQFLGHKVGERGALGAKAISPGTLILIDEGSMLSTADMADIMKYAAEMGCKVIISGDQEQLAAVEGGGGMMLLANQLGHVQLAEPVRFSAQWERDASLRLRAGDTGVLGEYDEHGRIRGADLDGAMNQAQRAYVAGYLKGRDTLLMAQSWEHCRALSQRIRDDLQHLGKVDKDGPEVALRHGAKASVGDLIIVRENDHKRGLANGDTLVIRSITPNAVGKDHITAQKLLDPDRETGERIYGPEIYYDDQGKHADLAYAVTGHSAQGRTVNQGIALVTGSESRQWLYVALTRGVDGNYAYVCMTPKEADPDATTRPAPELERHDRVMRERAGLPPLPPEPKATKDKQAEEDEEEELREREPLAVIADIVERDGAQVSAREVRQTNVANTDHLGILNAVWQAETGPATTARYEADLREMIPGLPATLSGHSTWLYRSLRQAEAAGCNSRDVLAAAIAQRGLDGARDVLAVLYTRVNEANGNLVPLPAGKWADQIPSNAERPEYVAALAGAMDARRERIGVHVAKHSPAWAVRALGPVPDEPLDRLEWESRASDIGAYREMFNYTDPTDAIGPDPVNSPEARTHWHAAFSSLGPVDGVDMRAQYDGSLYHMRDNYERATSWAPPHVAEALRQVRVSAEDQRVAAAVHDAEHLAARERDDHETGERHRLLSSSARVAERVYLGHEAALSLAMEARKEWETATEHERHLAVAADKELRHRYPDKDLPPLRSAEPARPTEDDRAALVPEGEEYQAPAWLSELAERVRATHDRLDRDKGVMVPSENPDYEPEEEAWPARVQIERDQILQAPKPEMTPAPEVVALAEERDRQMAPATPEHEAAE